MKGFSIRRMLGLALAALFLFSTRVGAQVLHFTQLDTSPNPAKLNKTVTFSIGVENSDPLATASNMVVVVTFDPSLQNISGSVSPGSATLVGNVLTLHAGDIDNGLLPVALVLTATPTALGTISNNIVASANNAVTVQTNIVVQVISAQADLGVTIIPPPAGALTNDWITFGLVVTNGGPDNAIGVMLTNSISAGVGVITNSQSYTLSGTNQIFSLGTVNVGTTNRIQILVQPTNVGVFSWSAAVGAAGLLDNNPTNNIATSNYTVVTNEPGELVVTNLAGMYIDFQAGLLKQMVRLQNTGAVDVASARVTVTGLTNRLYNAVGTNNGNSFVVYRAPLTNSQSVDLVLEYIARDRKVFTVSNSQYSTVAVLSNNAALPTGATQIAMTNYTSMMLTNGDFLIQFLGSSNRTYTIEYCDNDSSFTTNPVVVQPSVRATSTTIQWIDDGPPKGVSHPSSVSSRYYRVYLSP